MDFTYETTELRSLCLRKQTAVKAFGEVNAMALFARLADMAAVQTPAEFFDLFRDDVSVCDDMVTVRLQPKLLLRFKPGHVKARQNAEGQPDWSEIARVRIVFVGADDA